jgi:putative flippase GtrA
MGQYFAACGVAIGVQFSFTMLFAQYIHYLIANVFSIILAAVFAYLLNDIWTFSIK